MIAAAEGSGGRRQWKAKTKMPADGAGRNEEQEAKQCSMSAIELRDVTVSYDQDTILRHFNLKVEEGTFLTIIGSSGCGKTTALKLMNGLLVPEEGAVFINDTDISAVDINELRRNIGYVIQEIGLFPHMTVEKNISYVPNLYKTRDKEAIQSRVRELIGTVGLESDMLNRYPSELSGGQRQRVGIARALMNSPKIILMDEPFGAVDEITRRKLQEEILRIHENMGGTIVFVTHDIKEALKLGTRVLVMDQGNIIQDGSPDELRQHPATEFVSKLING